MDVTTLPHVRAGGRHGLLGAAGRNALILLIAIVGSALLTPTAAWAEPSLTLIVSDGDATPPPVGVHEGFHHAAVNNVGEVVYAGGFLSREQEQRNARAEGEGVWHWRDGETTLLAREGQPAPGVGEPFMFADFEYVGISDYGQVAVLAEMRREGEGPHGLKRVAFVIDRGLWSAPMWGDIPYARMAEDGTLIFAAAASEPTDFQQPPDPVSRPVTTPRTPVAATQKPVTRYHVWLYRDGIIARLTEQSVTRPNLHVSANGRVAATAKLIPEPTHPEHVVFENSLEDAPLHLLAEVDGTMVPVVSPGDAAPGLDDPDARFLSFTNTRPRVTRDGAILFSAYVSGDPPAAMDRRFRGNVIRVPEGRQSLWWWKDGELTCVFVTGEPIEGMDAALVTGEPRLDTFDEYGTALVNVWLIDDEGERAGNIDLLTRPGTETQVIAYKNDDDPADPATTGITLPGRPFAMTDGVMLLRVVGRGADGQRHGLWAADLEGNATPILPAGTSVRGDGINDAEVVHFSTLLATHGKLFSRDGLIVLEVRFDDADETEGLVTTDAFKRLLEQKRE